MGPVERDAVASGDVDEAVAERTFGVESSRQDECAQEPTLVELHVAATCRPLEELEVESDVVGDEDAALRAFADVGHGDVEWGCASQRAASDPVHATRPDTREPPGEGDERRPAVVDRPGGADADDADLQHAVAPRRETARLHVDDCEPRSCHGPGCSRRARHATPPHCPSHADRAAILRCDRDENPNCAQRWRQRSSAARLATSLRSHVVSVTWPKHGWSAKALERTASALLDSPR